MGKFLFESIISKTTKGNEEESELEESDIEDLDSDLDSDDAELQRAFAAGEIKPGLHGLVGFKRTESLINDKEGLRNKLKEIEIFKDSWLERLDLVSEPAKITPQLTQKYGDIEFKLNRKGEVSGQETADRAQHDFKREMLFYRQAQTTVIEGIRRIQTKFGIKQTARPSDYFAEMVKSDDHMKKVRERLQSKQNSIEASEKAKKLRDLKKYGKKVQQEVQLKRQMEKKEMLQKIQNYKKGKEETLDFLDDENKSKNQKGPNNTANKSAKTTKKATKKAKYKEAKYGYGGQKKRSKYNSADSAANMSGFSARKHGRPKIGKNKKQNRPGKKRRQEMRNKRKS
ncbi:putative rRNA-processing protein EBP2, partial [Blomia tropicalis]